MDNPIHPFSEIFKQLGLPDDPVEIDRFITTHSPLDEDVKLVDAPFWNDAQRAFLKESYTADADWIPMIDQLNEALHPQKNKAPSGT
ncbi:DUF2789 domain-containing protein [Pseudomonas putida]|uniref:DUF2789 domain-containing protein n=1 Tax=Pseudomonas putida TaxID=303 RepID=UPI0003110B1B|nr:DUF2789 domain-containing protein [Pseudomonas putida]